MTRLECNPAGGSARGGRIGKPNAVVVEDGASVTIERVVVAGVPLFKVMGDGDTLQEAPLKARLPQLNVTELGAFELGVMVSDAVPV